MSIFVDAFSEYLAKAILSSKGGFGISREEKE
jgi:hypothetical protein